MDGQAALIYNSRQSGKSAPPPSLPRRRLLGDTTTALNPPDLTLGNTQNASYTHSSLSETNNCQSRKAFKEQSQAADFSHTEYTECRLPLGFGIGPQLKYISQASRLQPQSAMQTLANRRITPYGATVMRNEMNEESSCNLRGQVAVAAAYQMTVRLQDLLRCKQK